MVELSRLRQRSAKATASSVLKKFGGLCPRCKHLVSFRGSVCRTLQSCSFNKHLHQCQQSSTLDGLIKPAWALKQLCPWLAVDYFSNLIAPAIIGGYIDQNVHKSKAIPTSHKQLFTPFIFHSKHSGFHWSEPPV